MTPAARETAARETAALHPAANWGLLSRAERDLAYDNRSAVAEAPEHNRERGEASAAYRAAHAGALDLPYGPAPRQAWDIFPGRDADAPCLVFIHGGYWQMNERQGFSCMAAGLAAHGWSVALPGYSLAPEARLADIAAEIRTALDWLAANGRRYGAGGRIVVSGWSAGAHLATLALDHPAVAAGLALSGIYELGPLRDTYLNEKLALSDQEIATLSPIRLPPVDKPLAVVYGSRELPALVDDARAFHAMRAAAHMPGPLVPLPGADHFTVLGPLRDPGGCLTRLAIELATEEQPS